jgi:hypothetical protein
MNVFVIALRRAAVTILERLSFRGFAAIILFSIFAAALCLPGERSSAAPAPPANTITLARSTTYQTMGGWEATAQAGQYSSPRWDNYKDALMDQATDDLGIDRIRLEVPSGIENPTDYFAQWRAGQISVSQYTAKQYEIINDNSNPASINPNGFKWSAMDDIIDKIVLPMRMRMLARGEYLWVNANYVDFGSSAFEHKNNPAEYAEFVLAAYQHMQSRYGFVPDSWEVILEPDTSTAAWSATQVAQSIKAAGDLLTANGFHANFVAPSVTNLGNASTYINQIAGTNGAMAYVYEFSYHRYGGATTAQLQNVSDLAIQYNKRTAMLEMIGADYNALHQDIKTGRISSWQQYTLGFIDEGQGDDGAQYYLLGNPNNPSITMAGRTKFLRQYFRFIRSGAVRIGASTTNSSFDPVAFTNTDGTDVVVVNASTGGSFNIQGLNPDTYGIKFTTASQYDVDLPNVSVGSGQTLSASIPAAGVITIYATNGPPPPTPTPTPSSTPTPSPTATPGAGGGSLTGSFANIPASVDLNAEGTADWAHWGTSSANSFDHKSTSSQRISNFSLVGSGTPMACTTGESYAWNNGSPTASANTRTCIYIVGTNNGFQISAPADTAQRTLNLYVGLWAAAGRLEATLSDGSAATFVDTSLSNTSDTSNRVYSLNYRARSAGQTLTVKWTLGTAYNAWSNVTLHSATLAVNGPPTPTPTPTVTPSPTPTATPSPTPTATPSPTPTATPTPTPTPVPGSGSLTGSYANIPSRVNLTSEGALDWAHWGLASANGFDRKRTASQQISNFSLIGSASPMACTGGNSYTWSDGSPTTTANTKTCVYLVGINNGFQITAPADATQRTLKLYAGLWSASGRLEATLSDGSAPSFVDTTLSNTSDTSNRVYILKYRARSAGQMLTVKWTLNTAYSSWSNVTLQAATLGP